MKYSPAQLSSAGFRQIRPCVWVKLSTSPSRSVDGDRQLVGACCVLEPSTGEAHTHVTKVSLQDAADEAMQIGQALALGDAAQKRKAQKLLALAFASDLGRFAPNRPLGEVPSEAPGETPEAPGVGVELVNVRVLGGEVGSELEDDLGVVVEGIRDWWKDRARAARERRKRVARRRRERRARIRKRRKRRLRKFRESFHRFMTKIAKSKALQRLRAWWAKTLKGPVGKTLAKAGGKALSMFGVPPQVTEAAIRAHHNRTAARLKKGGWAGVLSRASTGERGAVRRELAAEAKRHGQGLAKGVREQLSSLPVKSPADAAALLSVAGLEDIAGGKLRLGSAFEAETLGRAVARHGGDLQAIAGTVDDPRARAALLAGYEAAQRSLPGYGLGHRAVYAIGASF